MKILNLARKKNRLLCFFIVSHLSTLAVAGQMGNEKSPCPNYKILRQDEDWKALVRKTQTDFWTPYKYIPSTTDSNSWWSLGMQLRNRVESWHNFGFNPKNKDTFNLFRFMPYADIHFNQSFRFFVQGKTAASSNRNLPGGIRNVDRDDAALQQAFADFKIPLFSQLQFILRPGRRELLFGAQRLISPLPWANTERAWDGVSAIIKNNKLKGEGFYTLFAPVQQTKFNSSTNRQILAGWYSTHKFNQSASQDIYWLYVDLFSRTFAGPLSTRITASERIHTLGTRFYGKILGDKIIFYDTEFAYQFGRFGQKKVSAFMFASILGHQLANVFLKPTLALGFDYASGGNPARQTLKTFNQLYPLAHKYYGLIDLIGRQNAIDLHVDTSIKPLPLTQLGANFHQFWLANSNDALYGVAGQIVRNSGVGRSSSIGSEIDTYLKHRLGCHFFTLIGYSRFFSGAFIKETGLSKPINFTYVQFQYNV